MGISFVPEETDRSANQTTEAEDMFLKNASVYYQYALEWCSYPHWTIEETANLLTGCVPHRTMFLRGDVHAALDEEVLATENLVRADLNKKLEVVKSRKYFGKTYLLSEQVFAWANRKGVVIPRELARAEEVVRNRYKGTQYTTPCLEAARWVVLNYWENANLREPPASGAIIQALLQQFPELSGHECDMIEQITRHPLTRLD